MAQPIDVGLVLDSLKGKLDHADLERFFEAERFPFPRFAAVLVEESWKQELPLVGCGWVRDNWRTAADHERACGVLSELFNGK